MCVLRLLCIISSRSPAMYNTMRSLVRGICELEYPITRYWPCTHSYIHVSILDMYVPPYTVSLDNIRPRAHFMQLGWIW